MLFQRWHFHILLTQHCIPLALIQLHISTFTSQVFRTGRTKGGIFRDGQAGGGDWPPVLRLQLGQCDRGRQQTSGDTTAERKGSSGTVKQAIDNSSEPRRSLLLSTSVLVTRSHIISVTRSLGVPLPRPRGVPESHCLDHAESRSPMVPVTRSPLLSTSVLVTRSHITASVTRSPLRSPIVSATWSPCFPPASPSHTHYTFPKFRQQPLTSSSHDGESTDPLGEKNVDFCHQP